MTTDAYPMPVATSDPGVSRNVTRITRKAITPHTSKNKRWLRDSLIKELGSSINEIQVKKKTV